MRGLWSHKLAVYTWLQVLTEDIEPALQKLRQEKAAYSDWQARSMRLQVSENRFLRESFPAKMR